MFRTLQQRIVFLTASMILLTGAGLSAITLYDGYVTVKEQHLEKLKATVIETGSLIESDLYLYNIRKLRNTISSIRYGRELDRIWVLDAGGRLITDGTKSPTLRNRRPDFTFIDRLTAATKTTLQDGENYLWAGHPVTITGNDAIGYVVAATKQTQFQSVVTEQLWKYFLLLAPMLLLSVLLAALLGWRISRPLSEITLVAREISRGNLDVRAEVGSSDEVGVLSHTINDMADHLSQKINELQDSEDALIQSKKRVESFNQQLEKQVEERTKDLVKANQVKDEFLASMSHELRTPLTSIIGNSEFIAEKVDDQEIKELISSVEVAGRGQLALVNDILDMSKIESGKFTIDEHPYNLSALLQDVEHVLATRAHDAQLELVFEQTSREEHLLLGDGQRIRQILINLIGNAIKFTDTGTVSLTTHTDGNHLFFTVKDSGIGMSPEILDRLFQRFEQADGSTSRRFGGSGLGLFISLNLAEMMGGTIDVSSQEEVGSIFELILPYRPSELWEKREKKRSYNSSVLDQKLSGYVLVAEDTPELQLLERRILEGMGLTVTTANNGKEAIDLASSQSFDLILMDMQMPEIDGIEATKMLRSENNQTPIVALTANVMQKHRDAFYEAGCDGFIAKPIDKQELKRELKKHLH